MTIEKVLVAGADPMAAQIVENCGELGINAIAFLPAAETNRPGGAAILDAAHKAGADALHPGYGDLARDLALATAVETAGLHWIGPSPETIAHLRATDLFHARLGALGIPMSNFKDGPDLQGRRHIEVSLFGFADGSMVQLFDRDCSVRHPTRHIVAEAPAPHLPAGAREGMQATAIAIAKEMGLLGPGTVEFTYDRDQESFETLAFDTSPGAAFRSTEMITGIDLIGSHIELAAGTLEPALQSDIETHGAALEFRINAEIPADNFAASSGHVAACSFPDTMEGLRMETAIRAGDDISIDGERGMATAIVRGPDRGTAIDLMVSVLENVRIEGLPTNLAFLAACVRDPVFRLSLPTTRYLADGSYKLVGSGR